MPAAPEMVMKWGMIDLQWSRVNARMRELRCSRAFSHWVWPILVHDLLNATSLVSFKAGVRANLVSLRSD